MSNRLFLLYETHIHREYGPGSNRWNQTKKDIIPKYKVYALNKNEAGTLLEHRIKQRVEIMNERGFLYNEEHKMWILEDKKPISEHRCDFVWNIFIEESCSRCGGSGNIPAVYHILAGVCFKCGGTGNEKFPVNLETNEVTEPPVDLALLPVVKAQLQLPV